MSYVVISDTHIGVTDRIFQLNEFITDMREEGHSFIWLGDNYDKLLRQDVEAFFPDMICDDDIKIVGNHDWDDTGMRSIQLGKVFLTHGDLVDFGYTFMRLSPHNKNKNFIERVLSLFRKWSLPDVYHMYKCMEDLDDEAVSGFHGNQRFKYLPQYLKLIYKLIRYKKSYDYKPYSDIPALGTGALFGYFTDIPEELLARVFCVYPESKEMDTIIIGHLHRSIDRIVTYEGRNYRLICLEAWTSDIKPPEALQISAEGILLSDPIKLFSQD